MFRNDAIRPASFVFFIVNIPTMAVLLWIVPIADVMILVAICILTLGLYGALAGGFADSFVLTALSRTGLNKRQVRMILGAGAIFSIMPLASTFPKPLAGVVLLSCGASSLFIVHLAALKSSN